jgi:dienelactone hydrolase
MAGQRVCQEGIVGVLFVPETVAASPGVLVLGGSGGGIREELAAALTGHGLACLALEYFGVNGLPEALAEIPLEYIEAAIHWLAGRPEIAGRSVGVAGGSKGAELALLAAATFPELIGPVVAFAPSSVVFFGLDPIGGGARAVRCSSWSYRDRPVPFVPYPAGAEPERTDTGLAVEPIYAAALANQPAVRAAAIPIERARGPILLISGDDDRMWPSARMAEMILDRLADHGRADRATHICYPGVGHQLLASVPAISGASGRGTTFKYGGSEHANTKARADAWARAGTFLRQHLA